MSENGKKTCFVIQGFGVKTDHRTGRDLNLDDSYDVIKGAVEAAGLQCIRADEIPHSGSIDQVMYEQILEADVVIADISTSNWNAAYELGVRHALRPSTTLIVAETQFPFEFDINHTAIMTYTHGGPELGRGEAKDFHNKLKGWIEQVVASGDTDSPVYTFLKDLAPPHPSGNGEVAIPAAAVAAAVAEAPVPPPATAEPGAEPEVPAPEPSAPPDISLRALKLEALGAKDSDWAKARDLFAEARERSPKSEHVYLTQQLALATYQSKDPDAGTALRAAKEILGQLDPHLTNDPETLGLWGAIHKRMYEADGNREDLDEAIWAHEKGFYLKDDFYNGINLAFTLNARAALTDREPNDRIADFVRARWVRERVIEVATPLADAEAAVEPDPDPAKELQRLEKRYWILATLWEAHYGIGDEAGTAVFRQRAEALPPPQDWMLSSTEGQLAKLQAHLDESPLVEAPAPVGAALNGEVAAELDAAKQEAASATAALAAAQQAQAAAEERAAAAEAATAGTATDGGGDLSAKLAAAQQAAAQASADLALAQQQRDQAMADAAQARALAATAGQATSPLVATATPAAVVAISDSDEAERVQFALVAPGVQFHVSGVDVEVTVKGRREGT